MFNRLLTNTTLVSVNLALTALLKTMFRNFQGHLHIRVLSTPLATKTQPIYLWPLFQIESWCSSFHMKISFHLHVNEI